MSSSQGTVPTASGPRIELGDAVDELRRIGRRLGTAEEKDDDFARARQLGHHVKNKMIPVMAMRDLGNSNDPAGDDLLCEEAQSLVRAVEQTDRAHRP